MYPLLPLARQAPPQLQVGRFSTSSPTLKSWHRSGLAFLFMLVQITTALAQPQLVKDINNISTSGTAGSSPKSITNVNGKVFFMASDGVTGEELWKSDGTAAGTMIVKDIHLGISGSSPKNLTNVNGILYFTATDPVNGEELWKSDGTFNGTVLVKDIYTGTNSSSLANFINMNGTLFFSANDGINGEELWKSNGTTAGTVMIKDIYPGSNGPPNSSSPAELTHINGVVYFRARDGVNGDELWKSDGTAAGTVMMKDIYTGWIGSYPVSLINVNGVLYFNANNPSSGRELWKSNGTEAGTVLVKDIWSGSNYSSPQLLTNVNGTLYFVANHPDYGKELWKSNGTSLGTVLVKEVFPGNYNDNYYPKSLTNVNGALYFTAHGDLWKSDGTADGTGLVKSIHEYGSADVSLLTHVNGTLFFTANDGLNGHELWKSDGTEAGTVLVKDITPGNGLTYPEFLTNINGTLFFVAEEPSNGKELWKSNGTEAGTVLVKDVNVGSGDSSPKFLTNLNGTIYFKAFNTAYGDELWKSDGTSGGTIMVKDIYLGSEGSNGVYTNKIVNVNKTIFFTSYDGTHGEELWKSDGTTSGTVTVKDSDPRPTAPNDITDVNGTLFFTADDPIAGREIWKSDGTATGTMMVKDINPGSGAYNLYNLTSVMGYLFFTADDGPQGVELWKSDGTSTGTVIVKDINKGFNGSYPGQYIDVNGNLFFTAEEPNNGRELWKSDGTEVGTVVVKDIYVGPAGSSPKQLVNINGTLFFAANDGGNGEELWKSNGTAAGTVMVKDIWVSYSGSSPSNITNVNGIVYFVANDGVNGEELWKSDGTAAGTVLVKDIWPGIGNASPRNLTNLNGVLYFVANEGVNGDELWKSDGTAAGTVLIKDINPGFNPSSPESLTNVNGTLFFVANHPVTGKELWKYNPATCTVVNAGLSVSGSTVYNNGSNATLTVQNTQTGVSYQAYLGTIALGSPVNGGGNITLTIPGVGLSVGTYNFTVRAAGCTELILSQTATVQVLPAPAGCSSTGTILREQWNGVNGVDLSTIPVNQTPSSLSYLTSLEGPLDAGDNYAARYRGYICAPETGGYTFWIASDNESSLLLSINDQPSAKGQLASVVGGFTTSRQWSKYSSQQSAVVNLVAGQRYYIEVLHKEGYGGDNLAVGWRTPSMAVGSNPAVVPGSVLSPFILSGNQSPVVSLSGPVSMTAFSTFTLQATASDADGSIMKVEFFRNGFLLGVDTTAPYSLSTSAPAGTYSFTAIVTDNLGASTTSSIVNITVGKATPILTWNNPEDIIQGTALGNAQLNATANVAGTFSYSPPSGTVLSSGSNQSLSVSLTPTDAANYSLISKVVKINVLEAPAGCSSTGTILREMWSNIIGTTLSDFGFNQAPNVITYPTSLEGPVDGGYDYASRYRGYICAPETGGYTFWIASDNESKLLLSINDQPSAKVQLAYIIGGYTNPRQWDKFASQQSMVIYLIAGQRYYIEVLHKQGGGGDNLSVGWRKPSMTAISKPVVVPGAVLSPFVLPAGNQPPFVSLLSPGSVTAYANFTLQATASDTDGSIAKVEFFRNDVSLGIDNTAPYSISTSAPAGSYSITAVATDNMGASTTSTSVSLTVGKATAVITWNNPGDIVEGTPLGNTQLNAVANVAGNFQYSPLAGTVMPAGYSQILSVNFTPTDIANYTTVNKTVLIDVLPAPTCSATGTVLREVWTGVSGVELSTNPLTRAPTSVSYPTSLEGPLNAGDRYTARYRGYICAPETGGYTFWISSDNESSLLMSWNDQPSNKAQLASITGGFTNPRQWNKYASQQSVVVNLVAGQHYYVEVLHKEGYGGDNLSVGWRTPSMAVGSTPVVVPGAVLSPFAVPTARQALEVEHPELATNLQLVAQPNPFSTKLTIAFTVPFEGQASLKLFDLRGMPLRHLFEGKVKAGQAEQIEVEADSLVAGMYLVQLVCGGKVAYKKIIMTQ